ncbi:MAG: response regulator [Sulfuricella denitrificans]|nr:response regulator [Sulfuricella denitrificans]
MKSNEIQAHAKQEDATSRLGRVLVVDDASITREILRNHLEGTTEIIDEAADGLQALERFQQFRYDAILLDIEMPGMDGYDTLRAMRGWEREHTLLPTFILAITSSDFPEDEQHILEAGASAYLEKPVRKQKLMAALGIDQPMPAKPHPMENLLPQLIAYAENLLNEIETENFNDTSRVSKKFHELRGSLATFGFQDLAEKSRQMQFMAQQGNKPTQLMFEMFRHDLRLSSTNLPLK